MKRVKRYRLSVIEQIIQSKKYAGFRGGRIEVYDNKNESEYAIREMFFLIPEELMQGFCATFDERDVDVLPVINWSVD